MGANVALLGAFEAIVEKNRKYSTFFSFDRFKSAKSAAFAPIYRLNPEPSLSRMIIAHVTVATILTPKLFLAGTILPEPTCHRVCRARRPTPSPVPPCSRGRAIHVTIMLECTKTSLSGHSARFGTSSCGM